MSSPEQHLARATGGSIVELSEGERCLQGFADLEGFGRACAISEFDQQAFLSRVIELARDPDPKVKSRGLALFWKVYLDTLKLNGAIGQARQDRSILDEQGRTVGKQTVTTTRLIDRLSKENPNAKGPVSHTVLPARDAVAPLDEPPLQDPGPGPVAGPDDPA